jgi:hypothetical protein
MEPNLARSEGSIECDSYYFRTINAVASYQLLGVTELDIAFKLLESVLSTLCSN